MRATGLAAVLAVAMTLFALLPGGPAEAGGYYHRESRCCEARVVEHHIYYPRYRHVYRYTHDDPYAYRYRPRGYYPYYNSGYWRPAYEVRRARRHRLPPYYKAWGETRPHYHHRRWHREHHGRIRHGHW